MPSTTACKACGKQVSTTASKCPHCGQQTAYSAFTWLFCAAVGFGVFAYLQWFD